MYRYSNGQISLSDFQQPMGMHLRENNRWVKKAQSIPWDKIEAKYADLFPSETGNVAKPLQLALGACLIQREYGYSDVETVLITGQPNIDASFSSSIFVAFFSFISLLFKANTTGIPN